MLKRHAADNIDRQKTTMIAAMYANGNLGGDDLEKAVTGLEKHYKEAMERVYPKPGAKRAPREQEIDWTNPFWAGAKASYDRQRHAVARLKGMAPGNTPVQQVVDIEAKRKRMREIDQVR